MTGCSGCSPASLHPHLPAHPSLLLFTLPARAAVWLTRAQQLCSPGAGWECWGTNCTRDLGLRSDCRAWLRWLPSPDEPRAQRRCGPSQVLPLQGAQPPQLQHPTLRRGTSPGVPIRRTRRCSPVPWRWPLVREHPCRHSPGFAVQPWGGLPPPGPEQRRSEAVPDCHRSDPSSPQGAQGSSAVGSAGGQGEARRRNRSMGGSCPCRLPSPPRLSLPSLMGNQRLIFSNPTL